MKEAVMAYTVKSPEEVKWAKDWVKELKGEVTTKAVRDLNLLDEYKKRFSIDEIKEQSFVNWLVRIAIKNGYRDDFKSRVSKTGTTARNRRQEPDKKVFELLLKSEYILFVPPFGLFGFDTPEEVKECMEESRITQDIRLFKRSSVKVKYSVDIE